jgi:hypothetical protein
MLTDLGVTVEDNARMWRADGVPFDPKAWTRIAGDGDVEGETVPTGGYGVRPDDGNAGAVAAPTDAAGSGSDGSGTSQSADELRALTVPQLKALLKEAGLKVGGRKEELLERLMEASPAAAAADDADIVSSAADDAAEGGGGAAATASGMGVEAAAVEALLEARGLAKQAKDYEKADEIAARLRSDYGVVCDDKRRTWRVVVEFGGYYRVGPHVDPFTTKQVGDMLAKRTGHKELKEYEEADALHAQLTEMGIVLDTRLRTWKKPSARERPKRY